MRSGPATFPRKREVPPRICPPVRGGCSWPTRAEARREVARWIGIVYNRRRRHSSLDYTSPAAFESTLDHDQAETEESGRASCRESVESWAGGERIKTRGGE